MEENGKEKKAAMQTKEELMLIVYVYEKMISFGRCVHSGTRVFRIRKGS